MNILYIIIIILSIIICFLTYISINLFKKTEKQEELIINYTSLFNNIQDIIHFSDEKLKLIDQKNIFKGDDEIGWFFEQIKYIQGILNIFDNHDTKEKKQ